MDKSFGGRLAAARKAAGYNQTQVAQRLTAAGFPVHTQAVSKWETGLTVPNARQLIELCRLYGIRDVVSAFAPAEPRSPGRVLPLYELAVSAGTGEFLDGDDYEMRRFDADAVPAEADFCLRVGGDSMEPVFHDGQIVFVRKCAALRPGEVGIFSCDGEGYIKVYGERTPLRPEEYTDSQGVVHRQPVLVSYNKAYPDRVIAPDADFRILGRVL